MIGEYRNPQFRRVLNRFESHDSAQQSLRRNFLRSHIVKVPSIRKGEECQVLLALRSVETNWLSNCSSSILRQHSLPRIWGKSRSVFAHIGTHERGPAEDRSPTARQCCPSFARRFLAGIAPLARFEIKPEGFTCRAKNDRHNIVVTGNRWFDNKAGLGGLRAIDLQMHLTGEDFAATGQTLQANFKAISPAEIGLSFPIERHIRSEQERRPFHELAARYAVPNEANWPIARAYLVETRGIDPAIVDDLHAVGTIFANDHRPNPSIVFLHRTQHGKVEGATLRDTWHHPPFVRALETSSPPGSRSAISIKRKSLLQSNLPSTR